MGNPMVTPAERRKLLADASPRLGEVGLEFLEAGRWGEALECLDAAKDSQGLSRIKDMAVQAGDLFYAQAAAHALGEQLSEQELTTLAKQAKEAGKDVFAHGAAELEVT